MGGSGGTSLLETAPYIIALVFTFFLVVTLGFERVLHIIMRHLKKKGKHGLVAAMNNMTNELMLLGFATLILLGFQRNIVKICIPSKAYAGMTWLDHVNGCACCLTRTRDVSPCNLAAKGCQDNATLSDCCYGSGLPTERNKVCAAIWDSQGSLQNAGEASGAQLLMLNASQVAGLDPLVLAAPGTDPGVRRRSLLAGPAAAAGAPVVECDGRIQVGWPECGYKPGQRPAIGETALHQVHLFIFFMAIVHILGCIALMLLASMRMNLWERWGEAGDAHARLARQHADGGAQEHQEIEMAARSGGADEKGQGDASAGAAGKGGQPHAGADVEAGGGQPSRAAAPDWLEVERKGSWRGRPRKVSRCYGEAVELFWCVVRQFNVRSVVHQEEFQLMRASFYFTHHIDTGAAFDFGAYMRSSMEEDYAHLVGLGLGMWLFLIAFVLLSTVLGWCVWLFTLLAGVALLAVNTKLVYIARYVTRGGLVHRLQPGVFWLNRPWLLLPVIKALVFFNTFVFANTIFFATQFGPHSCFFSRTGFQGSVPLSWWAVLLVNIIYFAWLCHLTLPLYSLVVHMGTDIKHEALPPELRERLAQTRARHQQAQSGPSGFSRLMAGFHLDRASQGSQADQAPDTPLVTPPHSTSKHA